MSTPTLRSVPLVRTETFNRHFIEINVVDEKDLPIKQETFYLPPVSEEGRDFKL